MTIFNGLKGSGAIASALTAAGLSPAGAQLQPWQDSGQHTLRHCVTDTQLFGMYVFHICISVVHEGTLALTAPHTCPCSPQRGTGELQRGGGPLRMPMGL